MRFANGLREQGLLLQHFTLEKQQILPDQNLSLAYVITF